MIALQTGELRAVADYVHSISAITLDDSKGYLVEGRLRPLAVELGCRCFSDLLTRARADHSGAVRRRIIDAITTGETLFFRDSAPFELLRHKLLPDLLDRRARLSDRTPIRVWSAACSTGQEVYSIAIVAHELQRAGARFELRLLGTDISQQAVARASRAIYNAVEIARGLDDRSLAGYFLRSPEGWRLRDEIRAMASFRSLNLMADFSALGRFDIIFCRNVAIYFNERDRISLFQRLTRALDAGGSLLVGAMESLHGISQELECKRHLNTPFYQVKPPVHGAAR